MNESSWRLFEVFGVELEYMIVDRQSLDVMPIADLVLKAAAGEIVSEVELGQISWSNELALHVVELKTTDPAPSLSPLPAAFQEHVGRINAVLEPLGGRLMPAAMHPWMDPVREMRLWPHEYNAVYEAFNRIFDCSGHGWANLQSAHLNLPFGGDEEFGRLHAAIRLVLPILPALAASSPIVDGRPAAALDERLEVYRHNSRIIPQITGRVIPEPAYTHAAYQQMIFDPLYAAIAPHDPEGTLQHEWLNARGAIARFERSAIEIRVLDVQECPAADLAIVALVAAVLRALVDERWTSCSRQQSLPTELLEGLLLDTIRSADESRVGDRTYLDQFGWQSATTPTARQLWRHLMESTAVADDSAAPLTEPLKIILEQGPLSRRILRRLAGDAAPEAIRAVYRELCDCLAAGRMFQVP